MPCRIWVKSSGLEGSGREFHERNVVGLYPPSGRMRMHCCGAFQTWRTVWHGACLVWWDVLFQSWMTINVAFLWIRRSVETLNTLSTMLCLKTNIYIYNFDLGPPRLPYGPICHISSCRLRPMNPLHPKTQYLPGILETHSAFQDEGMYALAVIDWLVVQHNELVQIVARILVWYAEDITLLAVPVFPSQGGNGTCYWLC